LWEGSPLVLARSFILYLIEVPSLQVLLQDLEGGAFNDRYWIDNIAERFGHLATFGIPDKRVTIYFLERDFTGQFKTQHDHTGNYLHLLAKQVIV
jgi:hypothetical protein